jgi:hypothetical protein
MLKVQEDRRMINLWNSRRVEMQHGNKYVYGLVGAVLVAVGDCTVLVRNKLECVLVDSILKLMRMHYGHSNDQR